MTFRRRTAGTRGVAAGRSAQRGTSAAATGGGGRSAPHPHDVNPDPYKLCGLKKQIVPTFGPLRNELQFRDVVVAWQERRTLKASFGLFGLDPLADHGVALRSQQRLALFGEAPFDPQFGCIR